MKNNNSTYKVTFYVALFLIMTISVRTEGTSFSNQNGFHIRYGYNVWGNQVREYKFKDVAEDVGYLTMFPNEEIEQKIPREILENWEIEYRIFTSIVDAELYMVQSLESSSLWRFNIIDYPLPKGEIGDNCWYQLPIFIEFIRNNVYVSIYYQLSDVDTTIAEWLAREVDTLLMESNKVNDANQIPAPQIQSVEILSELPSGWSSYVKVRINATDENSQKLFYRKYADALANVSENGELLLFLDKATDSMEDTSKAKVKIWVWNEDNITASVEKEIPF